MKMKPYLFAATALLSALPLVSAGDITGKITLKGTAPAPQDGTANMKSADPKCTRDTPLMTRVYVVGTGGGLADVVISIKDGLDGKSFEPPAAPFVIDQKGCEYLPYVGAVQASQKVIVKNSDQTLHNVNVQPAVAGNPASNKAQIAGGAPFEYAFPKAEEFLKFACNVHPWMSAYLSVFSHPFFAVSKEDGTFTIKNVPPGTYTIEAVHRRVGRISQKVTVGADGAKADMTLAMPAP